MRFTQDNDQLRGAEVVDINGDNVGGVGQVYLDETSGQVEWITVKTGFFGLRETLVPMSGATIDEGRIQVPFEKAFIKDAPNVDLDAHLDQTQQDELYRYYGDARGDRAEAGYGDRGVAGTDLDRDLDRGDVGRDDLARDMERGDLARDADMDRDPDLVRGPDRGDVGLDHPEDGITRDGVVDDVGLASGQGFGTERGTGTDEGILAEEERGRDLARDDQGRDDLARDGDRLDTDRDLINDRDNVADPTDRDGRY